MSAGPEADRHREVATQQHSSSECPSCGRFVGPRERCPYCGADVGQRLAVRVFKYGSLAMAIGGLAVLLFAATRSEVPRVEIGNLSGTMNWAYVRIEGVVTRQLAHDETGKTLRFWVEDGTGEIMVTAYGPEAEMLLAEGLVPAMGDKVVVEGTLRVKEDFQYLILDVPQHMEIEPTEPVMVVIAAVDAGLLHQKVTVRGVVRDERVPYEGLRILALRDDTGAIDVTLPSAATALSGELPDLAVGQSLQVTGAVDLYRGTPQISVGRGSDLVVLEQAIDIAPLRRIGDLSAGGAQSGGAQSREEMVVVEGLISKVNPFSAGVKYTLDDGSGTVIMLLWQDLHESLSESGELVAGTMVRAQGNLAEYRGELEIVPEIPSDVQVLAAAESDPEVDSVAERQLGELGAGDVGQVVKAEGLLLSLRTFSAGVRGLLDDGTGTVTLLLWQEVYGGLPDPRSLVPGVMLQVEGRVSEYKGDLEIVPQVPADVTVIGMVDLPWLEQSIGQITANDVGQTVHLSGSVSEVTPFSKGVKYTLDDGTGSITLLLWQNLYDQLADPALMGVGAEVSVRGDVAEYLGGLEVVPQLPVDVNITRSSPTFDAPGQFPGKSLQSAEQPRVGTTEPSNPTSEPVEPVQTSPPRATPIPSPTLPPTPTPAPETRAIGDISGGDVGRKLTIAKAWISDLTYFSKGVKVTLTGGAGASGASGSIILLLWQNLVEEVADRYDLFPGSQVQVTGKIDEYKGDLQIIPYDGADVVLLARGERLPIEQRFLNNVTPSDEGRIFTVEGEVTRTESNGWLKIWLNDGTGELLIFVPERTVSYLPAGAGTGARLRVTGEVEIYKGVIEIIPLAGADVEVR